MNLILRFFTEDRSVIVRRLCVVWQSLGILIGAVFASGFHLHFLWLGPLWFLLILLSAHLDLKYFDTKGTQGVDLDLTAVYADDWEALYINGRFCMQDHIIDWEWALRTLLAGSRIRSFHSFRAQNYIDEYGSFPIFLSAVPEDKDSPE